MSTFIENIKRIKQSLVPIAYCKPNNSLSGPPNVTIVSFPGAGLECHLPFSHLPFIEYSSPSRIDSRRVRSLCQAS